MIHARRKMGELTERPSKAMLPAYRRRFLPTVVKDFLPGSDPVSPDGVGLPISRGRRAAVRRANAATRFGARKTNYRGKTSKATHTAALGCAHPVVSRDAHPAISCVARTTLALVMVVTMAMPLAGCKDTDVLTELIIDQNAETDYSLEPASIEAPESEQNEWNNEDVDQDFDNPEESKPDDPTYDTNSQDNGSTVQNEYSDSTPNTENASSGGSSGAEDNGSGNVGDGSDTDPESGGDDTNNDRPRVEVSDINNTTSGDETGDDPNNQQQQNPDGYTGNGNTQGLGGTGQLYGQDGTYTKLPTNTKKIAASGQLATIVQMIGGKGALAAADSE